VKHEVAIKMMPKFGNGMFSITLILFFIAVAQAQGTQNWVFPTGNIVYTSPSPGAADAVHLDSSSEDNSKVGVFRNGVWVLDFNGNGGFDDCETDRCVGFGLAEDLPVTGDWNGSGTAKVGVFRNGEWVLDFNGNGRFDDCETDRCVSFGLAEDLPVTGDWNGSGTAMTCPQE